MNNTFLNSAMLEILLHIGTSFELKKTVDDALLSYVQQLDLAGVILFEKIKDSFIFHSAKPKILKSDKEVVAILDTISTDLKYIEQSYFQKSLPFIVEKNERYYYLYALEEFGYLMLIRHTNPIDTIVQKALRPINQKFANSLIACQHVEKLRAQDNHLLQQSRLAQMGEMISMIAHQWRQPLGTISSTVINMQLKLMSGKFDLTSKEGVSACETFMQEKLENIDNYVQGLSTTIDDFRNFYNPNKEKKICSIQDPIRKSLDIIKTSMTSQGIMIEESYHDSKSILMAEGEMMQVFLNIFKNAQDNFKEKKIQNPLIMIETSDTKEGIMIEISDNGGGIKEDLLSKIFDPYFSTKDEKNGTGLGLYMSKTIIEKHHEGLFNVSNKDKGACFTITLKT